MTPNYCWPISCHRESFKSVPPNRTPSVASSCRVRRGLQSTASKSLSADRCAIRPVQSASQWLTDHPDRRVQILCSEFSTFGLRRMIDRNLAAELSQRISIQPLPDRRYSVKNWWRSRLGQRDVFQAYLGLTRSVLGLYPPEPPAYLSPDEYEQAFLRSITTSRVLETPREPWRPECESKNRPPTGSFSCRLADELKQLVNQDRRPGKTVLLKKS